MKRRWTKRAAVSTAEGWTNGALVLCALRVDNICAQAFPARAEDAEQVDWCCLTRASTIDPSLLEGDIVDEDSQDLA